MIEQQDLLKRVEMLEQQVRTLQSKVDELEQAKEMNSEAVLHATLPLETSQQKLEPTLVARTNMSTVDQLEVNQKEAPIAQQIPKAEPVPQKPRKTIEQRIITILPKVFIVILVLGVLWGLKVASDYGYFSDSLKIVLSYIGSLALFAVAYWMEKKQKGSMQVALMLYGGAFVVGILTTAAGAILYEVLGLYVALFIAMIYIGYGVVISYVKGSESLTALVVLTSFLLPYLLEYMEFNSFIIVVYVVLLFGVLQLVILKHQQKYALYAGTFLSVLALIITGLSATDNSMIYPVSIAVIAAIFLMSMLKLFATMSEKQSSIHAGVVFSLLMYILLTTNIVSFGDETAAYVSLSVLIVACLGCTFAANKAGHKRLFDVTLSASLIAFLTTIWYFDTSYDVHLLLLFVTVAVGLLLANRLRAPFMQTVYSFLFGIVSLIIVLNGAIHPFWSVAHLTYILVVLALALLYMQLRKPIEELSRFEMARQKLQIIEWLPVALYGVLLLYSMHFQDSYLQYYSMSYISLLLIAAAFVATLFVMPKQKHLPLLIVAAFGFAIAYVVLVANPIVPDKEMFVGLLMRLLYIIIVGYALYNFMQGGIVREKLIESKLDVVWIGTVITMLAGMFGVTSFITFNDIAQWNFKVIVNTVAIFVAAAISLFIGGKLDEAKIRLFGLSLLVFGIIKLIFFDLSALDLLVRSVLFIVIGGAGLVLTNKLLTKK